MKPTLSRIALLPSLLLACIAQPAFAAPPVLNYLLPAGAQRGTTADVVMGGTFDRWPVRAWCDHAAIEVKAHKDKGKLTVTVPATVAPGVYWIRLHDDQGASGLRPFIVGTLPEAAEKEPNDDYRKAQPLDKSCVVNGRLEQKGDVDCFAIKVRKGQTLVASLDANRTLGSPMDAILQIVSATGTVLAENNDYHDLDPQVVFTAPADGTYVVRTYAFPLTPDSTIGFAGGETFIYRLTITTGPFVEHAFPLAVSRAQPGEVELTGWNIPDIGRKVAVAAGDGTHASVFHAQAASAARVRLEPHPTTVKAKSGAGKEPQTITLPTTVSGMLDTPRTPDRYQFEAKKGQKLIFQLEARSLGFPLSGVLRLTDVNGKVLSRVDEPAPQPTSARDIALTFTPSQDGNYRIEVADLHGEAGPRYVYCLRALTALPDYQLTLAADRFSITPGKPLELSVTIDRREGFTGEIELVAEGLPAGVTATPLKGKAGDKTAKLVLNAEPTAVSGSFRITGKVDGKSEWTRTVLIPQTVLKTATPHLWLTVAKPAK
jgi:Bacterial pre-peptidase C-terminal domain